MIQAINEEMKTSKAGKKKLTKVITNNAINFRKYFIIKSEKRMKLTYLEE